MGHTKKTHNKSQWKNYNYICYEFFSLHWHAVREGKGKTWRISIFQKNKSQKIWIRFFPERMPTTWSSCSQRQQKIQQRKQHYFFLSGKILCYFEYLEIEPKRRLITMFIDSTWFSVSLSKFKKKTKNTFLLVCQERQVEDLESHSWFYEEPVTFYNLRNANWTNFFLSNLLL